MRRIILLAVIIVASFSFNEAKAAVNAATEVASVADACEGVCYKGTLDNLVMNGKSGYDAVTDQCFHLDQSTGVLSVTVKQIGSMPGVIKLKIYVSVSSAGVITANSIDGDSGLYIGGLKATSFQLTSFVGTVSSGCLTISTCAVKGKYLGTFPASFSFVGTTCDGSNCECSEW